MKTQRQAKLDEKRLQYVKAINKIQEKLKKLKTKKWVAITIIIYNNNRFVSGK